MLKSPTYAIFSKSRGLTDIKYHILTRQQENLLLVNQTRRKWSHHFSRVFSSLSWTFPELALLGDLLLRPGTVVLFYLSSLKLTFSNQRIHCVTAGVLPWFQPDSAPLWREAQPRHLAGHHHHQHNHQKAGTYFWKWLKARLSTWLQSITPRWSSIKNCKVGGRSQNNNYKRQSLWGFCIRTIYVWSERFKQRSRKRAIISSSRLPPTKCLLYEKSPECPPPLLFYLLCKAI